MGRPRGSKNKFKTNGAATNAAAEAPDHADDTADVAENSRAVEGDNSEKLTEDQRFVLVDQHARRIRKFKELQRKWSGKVRAAYKVAKADLGATAKALVDTWIESESPEGEACIKARTKMQAMILHRRGTPVAQIELFPTIDPAPAVERATAAGKLAGMRGKHASPPYNPSVPQYQAWLDGWQDGQSILLANLIKPIEDPEPVPKLIPAGEGDGEAEDNDDVRPRFMRDAVDQAQTEIRQTAAIDEGLRGLAAEQAASLSHDGIDIPAEFRRG